MKNAFHFLLALALLSCTRSSYPPSVPVGDDRSIRFPDFHDQFALHVGEPGSPYQLDGVTLRAIMIAANDYLPPGTPVLDCDMRQEAQLYRFIRQGDIIFVSVDFNSSFCRPKTYALDGGARYAISTDGRILRRLVGIEPDGFPREEPPRVSIPVPKHLVGHPFEEIRAYYRDAGIPFPGESPADGGVLAPPDSGLAGDARDGGT